MIDAEKLEVIRLIAFYGRIDNGTGCLRNLTDGGEGVTGRIQPEEERRRRSEWIKALVAMGVITVDARVREAKHE
jgi:hypothetical protein